MLQSMFKRLGESVDQALTRVEKKVDKMLAALGESAKHFPQRLAKGIDEAFDSVDRFIYVAPRALWNFFLWIVVIWLEIVWIGFLFGSVLGVILVLIFAPHLFLLPVLILAFRAEIEPSTR